MPVVQIIILILVIVILIFTVWVFVNQWGFMNQSGRKSRPMPKKQNKFFMTTAPEFAAVYINYPYQNVSILGDHIPFQTVQFSIKEQGAHPFTFTGKTATGQDTAGNGVYDPKLDRVLLMIGEDTSLELHSDSPKTLLGEVQELYKNQKSFSRK